MFSGISEYFFGSPVVEEKKVEENEDMELMETEDDWVLVDVTNEDVKARLSGHQTPTSSNSSTPRSKTKRGLEESWFVTPPPCFTAGGHSPQELATSPMEDLLIEHPSMSVYVGGPKEEQENRPTRRKTPRKNQVAKRTHNLRVRQAQQPPRAAAVAARLGIQKVCHISEAENSQRQRRQNTVLTRNKLDIHNKNHHQKSLGRSKRPRNAASQPPAFYKQPR